MNQLLIYLAAILIVVPISKFLGLGSVIGYLIAGALIGPQGFALLGENFSQTSQLAEFGVIMMLLLIGLELNPKVLWKMRGPIFGLGGLQVLSTSLLGLAVFMLMKNSWQTSLTIGMILSLSSTAIVLQTLKERGYAKSMGGERAFSVLLFQDIAIIPILAILPLLGAEVQSSDRSALVSTLYTLGAVAIVILAGRFLIRPLFRLIARIKLREAFTALALFIVVAAATLMHAVGLSPALGAFLAGVVLADSEFRHQIESDLEPFKGLLLGLFFITIGASIQFSLLRDRPMDVAAMILGIVVLKSALIYALGRGSKLRPPESLLFAVSLAQGGEFAFVLIAQAGSILAPEIAQLLTVSIALSMAVAPILIGLTITHGMSRLDCPLDQDKKPEREADVVDAKERENPVLLVGIGRFGQTLSRFLRSQGIRCTVLDMDSEQIDIMTRFGIRAYFGDGTNLDLLRAAGIENARALVIAVDEPETTTKIIEEVRALYPKLPIFARVYDRLHAYKVLQAGATKVSIETSGSALALGSDLLESFGVDGDRADKLADCFRYHNDQIIVELSKEYREDGDRDSFIQTARQLGEQMEAMMRADLESPAPETASPTEIST